MTVTLRTKHALRKWALSHLPISSKVQSLPAYLRGALSRISALVEAKMVGSIMGSSFDTCCLLRKKQTTYNGETFCKNLVNSNGTVLIPAAVIPHSHAEAFVSRFFYGSGADLHPNFKKQHTSHSASVSHDAQPNNITWKHLEKSWSTATARPWYLQQWYLTVMQKLWSVDSSMVLALTYTPTSKNNTPHIQHQSHTTHNPTTSHGNILKKAGQQQRHGLDTCSSDTSRSCRSFGQ